MKTTFMKVISKITTLLEVKFIYRSEVEISTGHKSLFIIILKGSCSSLTQELSTMVAKIFQEETDALYRIFSLEYAYHQINIQNLFFIHGCCPVNLIYKSVEGEEQLINQTIDDKVIVKLRADFNKEYHKIHAFMEGADFYLEKENYPQAAFMLHQNLELWYRYMSLLTMGKERKSHSIKELQTYIKPFVPELGVLFNTEIEEEQFLLKQLDEAYVNARYGNNYHINPDQLTKIIERAKAAEQMLVKLFEDRNASCEKIYTSPHYFPKNNAKLPSEETDQPVFRINESEKIATIKKYIGEHYYLLKRDRHRKGKHNLHLKTGGYLDISIMISSMLKVCFLALDAEYEPDHIVQDPAFNVKEVLGRVLQMIPYEEMEFLDKVRELMADTEAKDNTD